MEIDEKNKTVHCGNCNPPSKYDTKEDYWKCTACGTAYRLDRVASTWWPEQWWSIKEQYEKSLSERRAE